MKEISPLVQPLEVPAELIIFGGSFNPPTVAHADAVESLAHHYDLPIWVMPSGERSDKPDLRADHDRLQMLGRVAADRQWDDQIVIADFELRLPRPSQTYRTLRALRESGAEKIHFVSGLDSLNTVLEWEQGEELLRDVHWLVVERHGHRLEVEPVSYEFVEVPVSDISSTEVRRRAAAGEGVGQLVTHGVAEYIQINQLYKELS